METLTNPELLLLTNNKQSGYDYRERRHDAWTENYTLYRNVVITDRLLQRQTVVTPLMKQTVQTLMKDVDDLPVLYFENLDNDKQKELFKNQYWEFTQEHNNMELQDIVDKKQVFLFGRSFDQWQIVDGKIKMTVQDPMDILVDRYCDPTDLHSSRFLIHNHIFVPLSTLKRNPDYDQEAISRLEAWFKSDSGLIKVASNQESLNDKNEKMSDMGLDDVDSPILGEIYVELSLHFFYYSPDPEEEEQIWLYVEAEDKEILMKKPLEEVIGVTKTHYFRNHYPYVSWGGDIERQDFWNDAVADTVRPSAKILNAWLSQLVENRTLRNLGMHYYDSTIEGFTPGSFNPVAWGWYGVPGDPNKVLKKVDIPELSESLDEMQFVLELNEKATGATSTQQGVTQDRQITLGEVQLALGEAKERIKGMSKFYTKAWKERGEMFNMLIEAGANKLDAVRISRKGKSTNNIYTREISPSDWMSKSGYEVKIWSQEEKNNKDTNDLAKLNAVKVNIPGNPKLDEIYQRKMLEFAGLTPQEINEVMEVEKQRQEMMMGASVGGVFGQGTPPANVPMQPVMPKPPVQI